VVVVRPRLAPAALLARQRAAKRRLATHQCVWVAARASFAGHPEECWPPSGRDHLANLATTFTAWPKQQRPDQTPFEAGRNGPTRIPLYMYLDAMVALLDGLPVGLHAWSWRRASWAAIHLGLFGV